MPDFDINKESSDIEKTLADVMKIEKKKKEDRLNRDELEESSLRIVKQLQELNDTIQGGIRSANLKEYRNTYCFNEADSLDADNPFLMDFEVISEMTKIVSVKLSFKIKNFRAYSTAATSGGSSTPTSSSGGGQTTSSGGDHTSAAANAYVDGYLLVTHDDAGHWTQVTYGILVTKDHTHLISAHDHTVENHDHTVTIEAHVHSITYGIHEEETSPKIMVYISRDNGLTYSLPLGSYTEDQDLDITRFIDAVGEKVIKFESDVRCRISARVLLKLDIKART